jgi:aspartate/methionine/tyrosine aminotransferase
MTGWRIGWMVVPEDLIRPVERLAQNLFISPPTAAQHAAVAAFDCAEELDRRVARYKANRDLLLAELEPLGLRFANPQGAFYLYADVSRFTNDSAAFCRAMLEGAGVATVPGTDFDEVDGDRFIRMCFAGTAEDMAEAARRLKEWLPAQG